MYICTFEYILLNNLEQKADKSRHFFLCKKVVLKYNIIVLKDIFVNKNTISQK